MRATWMLLGVLWLGCSVTLTPVPCQDDLHCLESQHCGTEAVCVEGVRTAQMVGESCRAAIWSVAAHASECLGGSVEGFGRLLGPNDVCTSVESSVASGRQVFRPEEFGACLRKLRSKPCGELSLDETNREGERRLDAFAQGTLLKDCPAFEPQVATGGTCANTADCQGGWCDITEGCSGMCRAYIPVSATCTSQDRCEKGSSCSGGRCLLDVESDGRCILGVKCSSGSDTHCENGRCIARRTEGPCVGDEQCSLRYRCARTQPPLGNDSPKECRPVKALGEACEPGALDCAPLSYCDVGSRSCRPAPGSSAPCGWLGGLSGEFVSCLESRCGNSGASIVCLPPAPAGDICGESRECGPTRFCRSGRCAPLWCG